MPEDKEKIVQTTIRMPQWLHKKLTEAVQARKYTPEKTSLDALVQEALRQMFGESTAQRQSPAILTPASEGMENHNATRVELQMPVPETAKESQWVQRLLKVLRSKHVVATKAITSNLVAFEELVDTRAASSRSATKRTEADRERDLAEAEREAKAIDKATRDTRTPGEGMG